MDENCLQCGGRPDYPGLDGCKETLHVQPTKGQQVVWAIEDELNDRRGVGWGGVDEDIAYEIRDALTRIVESFLSPTTQ